MLIGQPVELEDLTAVDDHIAKSFPAADKFSDDHAHQTEPDIDLHGADDRRNAAWDHYLGEGMEPVSVKSVDEHDFIWVYFGKFGIEVRVCSRRLQQTFRQ